MNPESRLQELQLELPPAPKPLGTYKPIVIVGSLAYLSGHCPVRTDGTMITGRVGEDLDQQAGYDAARQTGLAILATLHENLGSLDRVQRVVKTLGLINCTTDFKEHPAVLNGFSELMGQVFGPERGIGARSAVGASSLPGNIPVEVEVIVELT